MESDAALLEISIQPCPFGQRTPPIPTAQSITVARVASPVTMQRKYQQILLRALRKYFDGKRRLLKKGDLIAVPVDVSNATIFEDRLDGADGRAKQESLDEIIDLSVFPCTFGSTCSSLYRAAPEYGSPNAVAYFRVVNVEHNIARSSQESSEPDSHFAALMGELGCWMDPSSTRLVQTGVENAFVPDVDSFLDISEQPPTTRVTGYLSMQRPMFRGRHYWAWPHH